MGGRRHGRHDEKQSTENRTLEGHHKNRDDRVYAEHGIIVKATGVIIARKVIKA